MSTASQIIKRSLRLINVLASGETPDASMQADSLEAMNAMLDAWRTESLMVYAMRTESLTLTGASSYTIGASGDLNTTRPIKIEEAYWRSGDIDYPIQIAQSLSYARIADKTTSGDPDWLYYEPAYPLGTLFLHPIPTSGTLKLVTWVPLTSFIASDEVSLPPGYLEAITYQLAMRLAAEYGRPIPQEVAAIGSAAKKDIKRMNFRSPIMKTGLVEGRRYDIRADR
jgi:hypothetical protein